MTASAQQTQFNIKRNIDVGITSLHSTFFAIFQFFYHVIAFNSQEIPALIVIVKNQRSLQSLLYIIGTL